MRSEAIITENSLSLAFAPDDELAPNADLAFARLRDAVRSRRAVITTSADNEGETIVTLVLRAEEPKPVRLTPPPRQDFWARLLGR